MLVRPGFELTTARSAERRSQSSLSLSSRTIASFCGMLIRPVFTRDEKRRDAPASTVNVDTSGRKAPNHDMLLIALRTKTLFIHWFSFPVFVGWVPLQQMPNLKTNQPRISADWQISFTTVVWKLWWNMKKNSRKILTLTASVSLFFVYTCVYFSSTWDD